MSNNKLGLGNIKLKKGDLESKIIAKLFEKSKKVVASNTSIKNDRDQLTSKEREARMKALKTEQDRKITESNNDSAVKAQQAIDNKFSLQERGDNKKEYQPKYSEVVDPISVKKEGLKEEKKAGGAKETPKKNKLDFTNKRYSKYNQIREEDDIFVRKKHQKSDLRKSSQNKARKVKIISAMTVHKISVKTFESKSKVIETIQKLDNNIDIKQPIDPEIVELIVSELGHIPELKLGYNLHRLIKEELKDEACLEVRPPIVTVMGHVDHGKTTLIDAMRQSNIIATEHGGITQHIGAYQIMSAEKSLITIIDTPGHAAFTALRARGAKITDIVVLVISADDSIKEQTVEAINHIKAAEVPVIIAVNKIDKPEANVKKVINELLKYNIIVEELGGDVLAVPISARNKVNLDKLEEAILLQAGLLDITASPNARVKGVVLEAKLDKKSGIFATVIVESGTLKKGDVMVADTVYCKVRAMIDCHGKHVTEALPSTPIEVLGCDAVPMSGDAFVVMDNEKDARNLISIRKRTGVQLEKSENEIDDLFGDDKKQVNFVIKGDTQGSIEAISDFIDKFSIQDIDVKILHKAVGGVTESDILLAAASGASILAFCVRESKAVSDIAKRYGVLIQYYSIIYDVIDNVKKILSGLLPTIKEEQNLGAAVVRQVFSMSKSANKIAGCYVQDGVIKQGSHVRLLRDTKVIYVGKIKTLRRFKNDEREVRSNYECGISLENYHDIKANDIIESFDIIENKQSL